MSFFNNLNVGEYQRIKSWLDAMVIGNYIINKDLTVDVSGSVSISTHAISELPIQFNIVKGTFNISMCLNLITLKGCPIKCDNFFCCNNPKLDSLEGCPSSVWGFNCWNNLKEFTTDDINMHCAIEQRWDLTVDYWK